MAVARRSGSTEWWSNSTTAWITKPAGMAAGDRVLWHLMANAATPGDVVVTPPDHGMGMVLVSRVEGTNFLSVVYEGIATGSEPSQIDYATSPACPHDVGMECYSGAADGTVEAEDSGLTAADSTPTAGPITTLTAGAMLVALFAGRSAGAYTPDGDWTEGYDAGNAGAVMQACSNYDLQAVAGLSDTCTVTAVTSTPFAWHMLAITEDGQVVPGAGVGGASRMAAVGAGT